MIESKYLEERRNKMKKINIRPLSDLPTVGDIFVTSDSKYRGRTNAVRDYYAEKSNMYRIEIFDIDSQNYRWSTLCLERG
jgi:putative ribosome biogenesis GTPase RsgA